MNRRLKRFANIVTTIVSQKNKLKSVYIEFYIQIESIWKKYRFDEQKYVNKLQ